MQLIREVLGYELTDEPYVQRFPVSCHFLTILAVRITTEVQRRRRILCWYGLWHYKSGPPSLCALALSFIGEQQRN